MNSPKMSKAPAPDAPVESAPVSEAPVSEAPAPDAPVSEAPAPDAPVSEAPDETIPPRQWGGAESKYDRFGSVRGTESAAMNAALLAAHARGATITLAALAAECALANGVRRATPHARWLREHAISYRARARAISDEGDLALRAQLFRAAQLCADAASAIGASERRAPGAPRAARGAKTSSVPDFAARLATASAPRE